MKQRDVFTASEGDGYFRRNPIDPTTLPEHAASDPLLAALDAVDPRPARVLEVGASNGWRLECLRQRTPDARYAGIDPSPEALADGRERFPHIALARATAERLPFADRTFDLVVLGFCLYLCDRDDLFRIATETDRVLRPQGWIAIHDFLPDAPHRRAYAHRAGVFSYKMDHAAMFLWNPLYRLVHRQTMTHPGAQGASPDDRVAVSVLRRLPELGFPLRATQ